MRKKFTLLKKIYAGISLIFFLSAGFFYLLINKVSALEVEYPVLSGLNLNKETNLILPKYVLYVFNAGMFLGFFSVFISITIAGVMYFLSPISVELRTDAKDRFFSAISGLLILALTYLIITTINPQLSLLNMNKPPRIACNGSKCVSGGTGALCTTDADCAPKKAPGVYFYQSDCSDNSIQPNKSNVPDFGALKNKIISANIVQDADNAISYISLLYSNTNLWGQCQEIDPTITGCQSLGSFASKSSSASIYQYDFHPENNNPSDGGVYFFRKSCFNINGQNDYDAAGLINYCKQNSGGYLKLQTSVIGGGYESELEKLKFTDVPEEEQDCIKYDKNGKCCVKSDTALGCDQDGRRVPSLGGENISSIIVNGNYFVLLVYSGPNDPEKGPWTSCQEFPTPYDINKTGPQQIKWQNIRNSGGVIPNYVIIVPIKN